MLLLLLLLLLRGCVVVVIIESVYVVRFGPLDGPLSWCFRDASATRLLGPERGVGRVEG